MANANGVIGWDDEVSASDAGESSQNEDFVVLPDGTYPFKVAKVERGSFKGSQKLPPCNMVKVEIIVDGGDAGRAYVYYRFYMHTSCLWKIYQFFEALGLRRKGDTTAGRIPWEKVAKGMSGRCEVNSREYKGKTYNDVTKWLPGEAPAEAEEADDFGDSGY